MFHDVGNIFWSVIGIERHNNEAQGECCLFKSNPLRAIIEQKSYSVAGLKGFLFHGRAQAENSFCHCLPGKIMPGSCAFIAISIGDVVGALLYAVKKKSGQGIAGVSRDIIFYVFHRTPPVYINPLSNVSRLCDEKQRAYVHFKKAGKVISSLNYMSSGTSVKV